MSCSIRHPTFILCFLGTLAAVCKAQSTPQHSGIVFPKDNEVIWRVLSNAIHLLGASVLAYCLARRTDKFSSRGLTSIPVARWLVILIFIDSWLFVFAAGILISGVGLSLNPRSCEAGIFLCIVLYAISKFLVYWFLVEKVHLVHPHPSHSRLKSPAYRICILFVIGYVVVMILMLTGRIAFIRDGHEIAPGSIYDHADDGSCVIGLGRIASMSMLIYDLILNVFFTCMFLYPIYKSTHLSAQLRTIAKRTMIAATVSLLTSAINICVLTVLHGQELGWICLASCGADVVVNAVVIYAVTATVDDHTADPPEKGDMLEATQNRPTGLIHTLGNRLQRKLKPALPVINADSSASGRGILEKNGNWPASEVLSATRSVHFSPETSRHSRGFTMDFRETARSLNPMDESINAPVTPLVIPNQSKSTSEGGCSTDYGQLRYSRLGRRDDTLPSPVRPSLITTLPTIDSSPVEQGEAMLVEVRHEGPSTRKSSRCSSIVSDTYSRKRSKSADSLIDDSKVVSLSHAPSTLEEARERIQVLSALTEIGSAKRKGQTDQNLLEVSVVTQTDRRVERRRRAPGNDMFDDYHGRKYDRSGSSFSSSGGL